MSKVKRVKYFTPERKALISEENIKLYDAYLKANIRSNKDVKDTTYKVYKNFMEHFLVYIAEDWDNISLYSEDFIENAVEIMEGYIDFCQDTLLNNKKVINTKISTVSSFFVWSLKRKLVPKHPFDKQLDRMRGTKDEKIISVYYLDEEEQKLVTDTLESKYKEGKEYDIQDLLIWKIMLDSANRVGAISKLTISTLNKKLNIFEDIREKRGKIVEVAFSDETRKFVDEWLEMRKEMDDLKVDSFFITKHNGEYRPMTKSTIQRRIKIIGHILGLEDFRSHCIRKTTLNQIYKDTGNLDYAAAMGNHESVETTRQAYIKPKSKAEIMAEINKLRNKKQNEETEDKTE